MLTFAPWFSRLCVRMLCPKNVKTLGLMMRSYFCSCGARVFNDNVQCIACGAELGFCSACQNLAPISLTESGSYQCGHANCGAALVKCANYAIHQVCNRCFMPSDGGGEQLCDC